MIFSSIKAWLATWAATLLSLALAAALAWGGIQTYRIQAMKLEAAQALNKQKDQAAEKLKELNTENGKVTDELLKDRATAIADAASSAARLRLVSASASKAAAACRRLDEPAAAIIRQELREGLEREAQRADQVTIQLSKLQDYVTRVCLSESQPRTQ